MANELKPCPFCGGKANIERYGNSKVSTWYTCEDCGASLETGETFNHGAQWNRRASPNPLTNEQIMEIINKTVEGVTVSEAVLFRAAARAIEAAHGIAQGDGNG